MTEPKDATSVTAEINRAAVAKYAMNDRADFTDAERGLIAELPEKMYTKDGQLMRDGSLTSYITDDAPCPDTVNPALWRQSQVLRRQGLFKVVEGLYQVRIVMQVTIVDAPDGLVIIDTGDNVDLAEASMDLFRKETGNEKPVVAVIYTHTHFDHYGGVKGIIDEADVLSGKIPIVAPGTIESFNKHAIGENVITGNAMSRRMGYTFGVLLPRCDCGLVSVGLGSADAGMYTNFSYIPPTDPVTKTGEKRMLGGWEFEFLYAPDTEAPEEMHIWIPAINALTCAENANHAMHNIQTIRGARTRDARNFARYLDETLVRWGDKVEVHFGPHTWPVWGNEKVIQFLEDQRDMYKFIYDQSLRLANQGLTPLEAAEILDLPQDIGKKWYNRYYHGGLHHNVRAVFHKELGFWDGDPATILPLLPADNAKRHTDLIGRDKILATGRAAIDEGDYRWAVQILHHLVFTDPDDSEARDLQADAYEQLGYQQEVPQYRGLFLCAAKELRNGVATEGQLNTDSLDTILAMPIDLLFDFAGVHLNGPAADSAGLAIRVNWTFTGTGDDQPWTMWIRGGVLNARPGHAKGAQLTLAGSKPALAQVLLNPSNATELISQLDVDAEGDTGVLTELAKVTDTFDPHFNLITP